MTTVTLYRPEPADGPWLMAIGEDIVRPWEPGQATRAWLAREVGQDIVAMFEAEFDGETMKLGRRLDSDGSPGGIA